MLLVPAFSRDGYLRLVSGQAKGPGASLARIGLWCAGVAYGHGMRLRNWAYDRGWKASHKSAVPVVSVGNITLGGTGKTPCVEYVARHYRGQEQRVAILSRGYGSSAGRNDEALLLEQNLPDVPHLQGADRLALAGIAVEELDSEIVVLDDGFQHRRLARDLDIVLLDATNPWGFGNLFPRGLLREPPRSLARAGMVLLTRCDQAPAAEVEELRQRVSRLAPGVAVGETSHRPAEWINADRATAALSELATRPAAAFCGIGNPDAFRRTLADCGIGITAFRVFPDHHAYTRDDVEDLRNWASQQAKDGVVVTTQKDLVKLSLAQLGGKALWALRICLHFLAGQETLDRKLNEVLAR
jgi:tetraacyldisaccharide 4'-kinase